MVVIVGPTVTLYNLQVALGIKLTEIEEVDVREFSRNRGNFVEGSLLKVSLSDEDFNLLRLTVNNLESKGIISVFGPYEEG